MEKIVLIKQRMQAAQDQQKSYADRNRKPMEFEVGDRVMLKVSPWKGVVRFGKRGKLNPRYDTSDPFKVVKHTTQVLWKRPVEINRTGDQMDLKRKSEYHWLGIAGNSWRDHEVHLGYVRIRSGGNTIQLFTNNGFRHPLQVVSLCGTQAYSNGWRL
ncbi:hypothetical protein Tco_1054192 [Tanacetum coccineum]|uniref:Reverse transcriptase domain-containing protein n=1 Tax=Tanacetum coccineum TaxID=301880 RepID=A0ABQ5GW32_9ASTR